MDYLSYSEELNRLIRKRLNDLADYLANGHAKDYAEYQKFVGVIQGLGEAEALLKDLRKDFDREQET